MHGEGVLKRLRIVEVIVETKSSVRVCLTDKVKEDEMRGRRL